MKPYRVPSGKELRVVDWELLEQHLWEKMDEKQRHRHLNTLMVHTKDGVPAVCDNSEDDGGDAGRLRRVACEWHNRDRTNSDSDVDSSDEPGYADWKDPDCTPLNQPLALLPHTDALHPRQVTWILKQGMGAKMHVDHAYKAPRPEAWASPMGTAFREKSSSKKRVRTSSVF